ncbi:uncharacterized protein LOC141567244 [Rhinolophus sinicus]|uniref:uncharacterized protein LOC141567244 n=1 Tax=Rhinolophus sinicus TaxID=89399 RepID=UPI003D7B1CA7
MARSGSPPGTPLGAALGTAHHPTSHPSLLRLWSPLCLEGSRGAPPPRPGKPSARRGPGTPHPARYRRGEEAERPGPGGPARARWRGERGGGPPASRAGNGQERPPRTRAKEARAARRPGTGAGRLRKSRGESHLEPGSQGHGGGGDGRCSGEGVVITGHCRSPETSGARVCAGRRARARGGGAGAGAGSGERRPAGREGLGARLPPGARRPGGGESAEPAASALLERSSGEDDKALTGPRIGWTLLGNSVYFQAFFFPSQVVVLSILVVEGAAQLQV